MKLSYKVTEVSFRGEVVDSVKRVFGLDIGKGHLYRILTLFKSRDFWIGPFPMVYDTGAAVSPLPFRFFKMLNVERFTPLKLTRISPEMEIPARLIRAILKFIDLRGLESPEIEA